VISLAEITMELIHSTSAFRTQELMEKFQEKKMLFTTSWCRSGESVLEIAKDRFPRHDATAGTFSFTQFHENFTKQWNNK
jgi:hypothetical protein